MRRERTFGADECGTNDHQRSGEAVAELVDDIPFFLLRPHLDDIGKNGSGKLSDVGSERGLQNSRQ